MDRREKMLKMFDKARQSPSKYDVMVCYSGGKDSTFILKQLMEVYNLRVLAFTVIHPFMSEQAKKNIVKVPEILGVDHLEFEVEPKIYHTFVKTGLDLWRDHRLPELTGCNLCGFFHKVIPLNMAHNMGIQLLIHGEDPTQLSEGGFPYQHPNFSDLFKACFGDLIANTIYDPYSKVDTKQINYFGIHDYDHRYIKKRLNHLGIMKFSESDPQESNCQIFHYFAKKAFEINNMFPYESMISRGLSKGVATVVDQILQTEKNLTEIQTVQIIQDYRKCVLGNDKESGLSNDLLKNIKKGLKLGEKYYEQK